MWSCLTVSNDCFGILSVWFDQLIFERLLDLPKYVAVAHVFEYELALLRARQSHVLLQIFAISSCAAIALLKGVVHSWTKLLIFKCLNKRSNHSEQESLITRIPNAKWPRPFWMIKRRRSKCTSFSRRTTTLKSSNQTLKVMSKWEALTPATNNSGARTGTTKKSTRHSKTSLEPSFKQQSDRPLDILICLFAWVGDSLALILFSLTKNSQN